ncbi:MAG: hypothetical protein QNI88_05150 [Desulfobacterales bacterium]|nr:hypothetical protein [Desulfobacterales bacterium]
MSKNIRKKKRIKKRKKHSASNFMPPINANPTLNQKNFEKLPKIELSGQKDLNYEELQKVKKRLNFANHNDFRKLGYIRIVDADAIKLPSKELTTGCYFPAKGSKKAEIWLSYDLLKRQKGIEGLFDRLFYKDRLFENLFHELGHHKAKLTHSVDRFENEAYAEKFMLAYRKEWRSHYGPSKLYIAVYKFIIKILRITLIAFLFPFRNIGKDINLFYRNLTGEISLEEFNESFGINQAVPKENKKKWTHPLNKKQYRERFKLTER